MKIFSNLIFVSFAGTSIILMTVGMGISDYYEKEQCVAAGGVFIRHNICIKAEKVKLDIAVG